MNCIDTSHKQEQILNEKKIVNEIHLRFLLVIYVLSLAMGTNYVLPRVSTFNN
jgi:hypothetical protein